MEEESKDIRKAIDELYKKLAEETSDLATKGLALYSEFSIKMGIIADKIQPFENSTYTKNSYLFLEQLNQLADDFIKEYIPKDKEEQ